MLSQILPFVVSGIATGSIFGLAGSGLVLTYKTSGIFNFGYGALATAPAYVFYFLTTGLKLSWPIAFIISVLVLGPLLGLFMERIAARLAPQSTAMKIVGTIGLLLVVQALATIAYGPDPIDVPVFFPGGTKTFSIAGVFISHNQVAVTVIAVVAVAALYALFRFTRIGVAMRALVDSPELLQMLGINATAVRRCAWIIGSTFAALSGVLVAPIVGLQAIALTYLVVQAFAAAALGMFRSIPIAFAGGIALGIATDVTKSYLLNTKLAGLPDALPFLILIVVLLVTRRSVLVPHETVDVRPRQEWNAPPRAKALAGLIVLVPLLLVPLFAGPKIGSWTIALTQIILMLSLGLLVRASGQVSLAQTTFAAIGAIAASTYILSAGIPWFVAIPLAGLTTVPVGILIAIPAIRLSGLFLALATFGFAIMVERLFYPLNFMFTSFAQGRQIPRPSILGSDVPFYYLVLAITVIIAVAMVAVHRVRLGRLLRGMSETPIAVATLGLNTITTKVLVFCLSAFLAGVAGALYGSSVGYATPVDPYFGSFGALVLIATLAIAPFGVPWYALFGLVSVIIPAYVDDANAINWLNCAFGVFAVLVAMQGGTPPMHPRVAAWIDRVFGRRQPATLPPAPAGGEGRTVGEGLATPRTATSTPGGHRPSLEVRDLVIRFGGLTAVDNVSIDAPAGRITGLLGPNGAGKTTTFNACSGLNRPSSGTVSLHGRKLGRLAPGARARLGLGRTFQRMQLADSLTVAQNVMLGREARLAGTAPWSQLAALPAQQRETRAAAASALELCGIEDLADTPTGSLSTGQRRLTELARCIAGGYDILLLDEPSSGLDRDETARFGEVLTHVVAERGCGILLVEHDMSLVLSVCSHLYVLDFGELIFEGSPAETAASPIVQAAYLGTVPIPEQSEQPHSHPAQSEVTA